MIFENASDAKYQVIYDAVVSYADKRDVISAWNLIASKENQIFNRKSFGDAAEAFIKTYGIEEFVEKVQNDKFDVNSTWWFFDSKGNFSSIDEGSIYDGPEDNPLRNVNILVDEIIKGNKALRIFAGSLDEDFIVNGFLDYTFEDLDDARENAERTLYNLISRNDVDLIADDWDDIYQRVSEMI